MAAGRLGPYGPLGRLPNGLVSGAPRGLGEFCAFFCALACCFLT